MKIIYILKLLILLILFSCATPEVPSVKNIPASGPLFSNGIYYHSVEINILKSNKQFKLNGVLKITNDQLAIVALSPFGSTVLEIVKKVKSNLKITIYNENLKKHQSFVTDLFNLFTKALVSNYQNLNNENSINIKNSRFNAQVYFKNRDNFFKMIKVEGKDFNFIVSINKYEKL